MLRMAQPEAEQNIDLQIGFTISPTGRARNAAAHRVAGHVANKPLHNEYATRPAVCFRACPRHDGDHHYTPSR
jgi:hypothetical protein